MTTVLVDIACALAIIEARISSDLGRGTTGPAPRELEGLPGSDWHLLFLLLSPPGNETSPESDLVIVGSPIGYSWLHVGSPFG